MMAENCIGDLLIRKPQTNTLGLLGTAAFAFFCFYLLCCVVVGATMLGLRLVFIMIHPMKWGATLMYSFLFNVALILLCSISVIQFCSSAFAYYAQATAAEEFFGHTLQSLRGIKYLYKMFDDVRREQARHPYVHSFLEHTLGVIDVKSCHGGSNVVIIFSSEDRTGENLGMIFFLSCILVKNILISLCIWKIIMQLYI